MDSKLKGLSLGAVDYIYKPFQIEELMSKIESLIRIKKSLKKENMIKISRQLSDYLLNKKSGNIKNPIFKFKEIKENTMTQMYKELGISKQQIKIIALLKNGFERKEICTHLDITLNTLKTQIKRIFLKCKVHNKTELLNIFY
jgi:DNA-binding NarL/FixJ family response regulator